MSELVGDPFFWIVVMLGLVVALWLGVVVETQIEAYKWRRSQK